MPMETCINYLPIHKKRNIMLISVSHLSRLVVPDGVVFHNKSLVDFNSSEIILVKDSIYFKIFW